MCSVWQQEPCSKLYSFKDETSLAQAKFQYPNISVIKAKIHKWSHGNASYDICNIYCAQIATPCITLLHFLRYAIWLKMLLNSS